MNPQAFIQKWKNVQLKERSFYQEHFLDLCHLVGHPTPAEDDPKGASFSFEAGAGRGFADVWKRGFFAFEYKGQHKDLDAAYDQLLRYREDLQNPPLLIVADSSLLRIHTNFTNTVKRAYELDLEALRDPAQFDILRAVFFEPERLKAPETPEMVTEQAAKAFAGLAEQLRKWGEDPARTAHFLIRLLFCLFAEDVGLLPRDLFTRLVALTRRNTPAFAAQMRQLFSVMATGGWFGVDEIAHFNGGLFDDADAVDLDSDAIEIIHGLTGLDWSSIEPSILGTLFERSLDPGKRAQLGAHYTSKDDILLIVEPVLMAPLRRRWEVVQAEARTLAAERDAETTPRKRQSRETDLIHLLDGFAEEIRATRVLDPACGSGNFLYVALRQLLDLWQDVSQLAGQLGLPRFLPTSAPSPAQLYGIEVNEYAHELAQATIWIGYIQWLRENGFGQPSAPILKKLDNIQQMDAILAYDAEGKPVEPEWPQAEVVIGNPPFLGGKWLRKELGDEYVERLFDLYEGKVPHQADLVCYWFAKSWWQIANSSLKRAGLLSTQNIRSGQNRIVLDKILSDGQIFMAWSDREWVLEGAAVRVSMVGFDSGGEQDIQLDGKPVGAIHSNLTSAVDTTKALSLSENAGLCPRTDEKGGAFEISEEQAKKMLAMPLNVNGRPNSDVIVPWMSGVDVVHGNRNLWIIDFGMNMDLEDASQYEAPFQYLEQNVKPERMQNRIERLREKWWIHRGPGISMREAREKLKTRYIATLRVSRHPIFVFVEKKYLPDVRLIFFAREDDYFFGVLQSKVHVVWYLETGTKHGVGNDPTYIPTTTFETFPFPWPPGREPAPHSGQTSEVFETSEVLGAKVSALEFSKLEAIAQAARELDEKRQRWLNPTSPPAPPLSGEGSNPPSPLGRGAGGEVKGRTLTALYNARPTWLDLAHRKLDAAVLAAYDWPSDLSDEDILARLLALNLARAEPT